MYRNWRELIRPKSIEIDHDSLSERYGRFVAEPLERGFGITVGNALRRILLSSIRGNAIVGARIEGALHEFTHIPGIVEDVADIVLNLKEVQIKQTGGMGEAWRTVAPDSFRDKARIVSFQRGVLTIETPDAGVRYLVEQWLRAGGQRMLAGCAPTTIRRVLVR